MATAVMKWAMGKCLGDDTEGQPQEQQKNLEIKQEQIKEQKLRILLPGINIH